MPNADYFAEKAARCRESSSRAVKFEIAQQLRLSAEEFEIMSDALGARRIGGTHPTRLSADDAVVGDPLRTGIADE